MENHMNIAKPNTATHYDVWENPPSLLGQHPMFKLKPPGTYNQDPANTKDIPGYEGRYRISPTGAVYSVPRKVITQSTTGREAGSRWTGGKFVAPKMIDNNWYIVLHGLGKPRTRSIKSLIEDTYGA